MLRLGVWKRGGLTGWIASSWVWWNEGGDWEDGFYGGRSVFFFSAGNVPVLAERGFWPVGWDVQGLGMEIVTDEWGRMEDRGNTLIDQGIVRL